METPSRKKLKPVRLDLEPEEIEHLRGLARLYGKSMAAYVQGLVRRRIKRFIAGDDRNRYAKEKGRKG